MKIVVGGQIDKQKVYDTIKGVVGDRASVEIKDSLLLGCFSIIECIIR